MIFDISLITLDSLCKSAIDGRAVWYKKYRSLILALGSIFFTSLCARYDNPYIFLPWDEKIKVKKNVNISTGMHNTTISAKSLIHTQLFPHPHWNLFVFKTDPKGATDVKNQNRDMKHLFLYYSFLRPRTYAQCPI